MSTIHEENTGPKYVAYFRVSTKGQADSGLGLEAQRATYEAFRARTGGTTIAEYVEVESGKRADRPELLAAVSFAKRTRSKLIIAKLDRLARNVHFVSGLMESGVDFVACDNPTANRLTIHILAAVAEDEAHRISVRTKDALKAARARGTPLGADNPNSRNLDDSARLKGSRKAAQVNRANAAKERRENLPVALKFKDQDYTLKGIAHQMNLLGLRTRRGGPWGISSVHALLKSAETPELVEV
jgi:DNA invertase Pin-like site-specific DNA recombinase